MTGPTETLGYLLAGMAVLCGVLFVYPYVIYPTLLKFLPEKPVAKRASRGSDGSEFSLIFSAHNEAASLPATLENLRLLLKRYPNLEVLVYDDYSSDATADLIREAGLGVTVVRATAQTGKAHGMKLLAARAHGEFIVCVDANVLLDENALDNLLPYYDDPEVGGVAGHLVYVNAGDSATSATGGSYWRLEEQIKKLEARSGSTMGADGSIFSVRKHLYPDFPDTVQDDFAVSMAVVYQGYRLIYAPDVIAREEHTTDRRDEFARKVRIGTRAFHTHLWMANQRRATFGRRDWFAYLSHKWLRWHGLFLLSGAWLLGLAWLSWLAPLAAILAIVASAAILAAGSRAKGGPIAALYGVLVAVTATGIGTLRARRGVIQQTWATPRQSASSQREAA